MSHSIESSVKQNFANIHALLNKTFSKRNEEYSGSLTKENDPESIPRPDGNLKIDNIRKSIKSNRFIKVEQLFASKIKLLNDNRNLSSLNSENSSKNVVPKTPLNKKRTIKVDSGKILQRHFHCWNGDPEPDQINFNEDLLDDFNNIEFQECNILTEINNLKNKCQNEQQFQQQVSTVLREFYQNNFVDWKQMAKYCNEVVHAHKCLLVANEKQLTFEREIGRLESKISLLHRMSNDEQSMAKNNKNGCLAIRNVVLKLRSNRHCECYFQNRNDCFIICLVQYKTRLSESRVLTITDKQQGTIKIDINEILFDFNQNSQVLVKFFFMFHPNVKNKNLKTNRFRMCLGPVFKMFQSPRKRGPLDISELNLISFRKSTIGQTVPTLSTNFSLLGQVKIDYSNANKQVMKLEHFNYYSIFEDEVFFDSELSFNSF